MSEDELPMGWALTSIDQVAINYSGNSKLIKGKLASEPGEGLYPAFSASGQDVWHSEYGEEGPAIIVSAVGARCGKVFRASDKWSAIANTHVVKINPIGGDIDYFYYLLNREHYWVKGGSAQPFVRTKATFERPFPLPPLAEQKRIVSKIEELFSELDAGEESLRRARRQLGVYRQSLLKQAFEGKLTAPWRKRHADLVEDWSWLTLNDIAAVTGGLTKNSKRDNFPTRIPYLRVANVYANELRLDEIKDIGVTPEEAKKVRLAKGDLLIVEGNGSLDQIGRVAVWDGSIPDCGHQNHLIRARCREIANSGFVLMFLLSPRGRELIEKQAASTSGLHTLSVSKVQRLPVPLCSLPEQREIVRLLDEQFTVIEQNEREIDAALKRSAALRQSILKKAFTGQLVPQDPTDEPASALLERIRKERDGLAKAPKKKVRA